MWLFFFFFTISYSVGLNFWQVGENLCLCSNGDVLRVNWKGNWREKKIGGKMQNHFFWAGLIRGTKSQERRTTAASVMIETYLETGSAREGRNTLQPSFLSRFVICDENRDIQLNQLMNSSDTQNLVLLTLKHQMNNRFSVQIRKDDETFSKTLKWRRTSYTNKRKVNKTNEGVTAGQLSTERGAKLSESNRNYEVGFSSPKTGKLLRLLRKLSGQIRKCQIVWLE